MKHLKRLLGAAFVIGLSANAALAQSQSFADFILSVPPAPLPLAPTDRIPVVLNNSPFTNSTAFVLPGDLFGTVTSVGFAGDGCVLSSTISGPITTAGTLTATLKTQSPATVLAGPVSGLAAKPCFRLLVGSDLPTPTSITLGGIKSFAAVPHEWINQIATDGTPSATQPAVGDLQNIAGRTIVGNASGVSAAPAASYTPSGDQSVLGTVSGSLVNGNCLQADATGNISDFGLPCGSGGGGGSVVSVGLSVPAASIFGVTGSPVTTSGTLNITTSGSSGGIPYFSSTSTLNSTGVLVAHTVLVGGGGGAGPTTVGGCTGGVLLWTVNSSDPTCTANPTLGASGSTGSVTFGNSTSGTVKIQTVAGALGTAIASLPANTGTIAELNLAQTWSAAQTFGVVYSASRQSSATTETLAATDCGTEVIYTAGSAITVTIPASIVPASGTNCYIAINQSGSAKVSVNGSAVTPATLVSAGGFTGTSGTAGSEIALRLTTIGATTTATLMGDGS